MRSALRSAGRSALALAAGALVAACASLASAANPAAATNGFGPGIGPQTPGGHWGGAYVLTGVPGLGYCIEPGAANPVELPSTTWSPIPYPGSAVYTDGEMAALGYFAGRFQGSGFPGYSVNDTVAAIAQVAYASAGGVTPPSSQAPPALVAELEAWIVTFAGPWTITVTTNPPSGSTFTGGTNYTGTVTVTSATGNGVEGLSLSAPPVGAAGEISNFVWQSPTTDAAGQIGFTWNVAPTTTATPFNAPGITVLGGAPGSAPLTYGAPEGSGGQEMLVSGASETLSGGFSGTESAQQNETGTVSVHKSVPDGAYYGPGGAVFEVVGATNVVVATLTTAPTGATPLSTPVAATPGGTPYRVHETLAPPGYGLAPDQTVLVYPGENTEVDYSGADEEPVLAAQLGAAKLDAETGLPLAGATFDFRFDPADDGSYSVDLGTCTTGSSGTCQPPDRNATGGWLPGWYQVTETTPPAGYWLNPTTASVTTFLEPGDSNVASVTFSDDALGSLQLTKSGDDTAYLPVTGAVFTVSGPAPTTTAVGTLTVGADGTTGVLTGLVPGSYTVTETTAPTGYLPAPPFSVEVTAGHATTQAQVDDAARPGALVIEKTDAETGSPLAGATFDTRFDSQGTGSFDVDLGTCTTDGSGTCSPEPNDGSGFLPGRYLVTETAAPAGYFLPTPAPSQTLEVPAGGPALFTFADPALVRASFVKEAVGNVNPTLLDLTGAVIDVTTATGGTSVASCTTDDSGGCTTAPTLVSGQRYCWAETAAPEGLAAGATGCFTANNAQGSEPITVTDAGLFVRIRAEKVDATHPATVLGGATFDLYRVGSGPAGPAATPAAVDEPGQTWMARATTGASGVATFPLQLPGFAYCTLEVTAPEGYVANPDEICTTVLSGSSATPPATTTLVTADPEATVTISAHKFNSAIPGSGIPGAVYDLYVEGGGPPSEPPSGPPSDAATEPGDRWWARGTTSTTGLLTFRVPAGYAWCLKEVSAPVDYTLDTGLHCTVVLETTTAPANLTVSLPETLATIELSTHKYNSLTPHTTIAGATYELVGVGALPPGWSAPPNPDGLPVPSGDWFVGTATTDATGTAQWSVPAGFAWCLHEISAPPDYRVDDGWHCTGVLTTSSTPADDTIALPEVPATHQAELALTGGPPSWLGGAGMLLLGVGGSLTYVGRRRRTRS